MNNNNKRILYNNDHLKTNNGSIIKETNKRRKPIEDITNLRTSQYINNLTTAVKTTMLKQANPNNINNKNPFTLNLHNSNNNYNNVSQLTTTSVYKIPKYKNPFLDSGDLNDSPTSQLNRDSKDRILRRENVEEIEKLKNHNTNGINIPITTNNLNNYIKLKQNKISNINSIDDKENKSQNISNNIILFNNNRIARTVDNSNNKSNNNNNPMVNNKNIKSNLTNVDYEFKNEDDFDDLDLDSFFESTAKINLEESKQKKKEFRERFSNKKESEFIKKNKKELKLNNNCNITHTDIVDELPYPINKILAISKLNPIQKELFPLLFNKTVNKVTLDCDVSESKDSDTLSNIVISAPTGSGKTVIFEIAICELYKRVYETNKKMKAVYIAPIKSLCQEKYHDWKLRFSELNLTVTELTGDSEYVGYEGLYDSNIIITTPERWESITRKWKSYPTLISNIALMLIDEVHLLQDEERGGKLEVGITRMKIFSNLEAFSRSLISKLRIIAASASFPNIKDLGSWLNAEVKVYGEEYRPVKIERVVLGYNNKKNSFLFEKYLNSKLAEVIYRYSDDKPTLVFCQTQKGTIESAKHLVQEHMTFSNNHVKEQNLIEFNNKVTDRTLLDLLKYRIAFHNAGLTLEDRKTVEELFKAGYIKVICTTSTLAQGVNLPARLVVIKSTYCYRGAGVGYEEYSQLEIDQMVGRAGRPGYDTKGVAVIMTENKSINKYNELSYTNLEIDSKLKNSITENINNEIAMGIVNDIDSGIKWLKNTFWYTRLKLNNDVKNEMINLDLSFLLGFVIKSFDWCLDNKLNHYKSNGIKNTKNEEAESLINKEEFIEEVGLSHLNDKSNSLILVKNIERLKVSEILSNMNTNNTSSSNDNDSNNINNSNITSKLLLNLDTICKKEIYLLRDFRILETYMRIIVLKIFFLLENTQSIEIKIYKDKDKNNKLSNKDKMNLPDYFFDDMPDSNINIDYCEIILYYLKHLNSINPLNDTNTKTGKFLSSYKKENVSQYFNNSFVFKSILSLSIKIKTTSLGKKMSKNFVSFQTIKVIQNILNNKNNNTTDNVFFASISEEKILDLLSKAKEVDEFRSKMDERKCLNELNKLNKYSLKTVIDTANKKSFVLAQSALSSLKIENWELKKQTINICSIYSKVIDVVKAIFLNNNEGKFYISSIILRKSFSLMMWPDSPLLLKQLPKIGEKMAKTLHKNGIDSFRKLINTNPQKIEAMCGKNYPFGSQVIKYAECLGKIKGMRIEGVFINQHKNKDHLNIGSSNYNLINEDDDYNDDNENRLFRSTYNTNANKTAIKNNNVINNNITCDNDSYLLNNSKKKLQKLVIQLDLSNSSLKSDGFDGYSRFVLVLLNNKNMILYKKTIKPRKFQKNYYRDKLSLFSCNADSITKQEMFQRFRLNVFQIKENDFPIVLHCICSKYIGLDAYVKYNNAEELSFYSPNMKERREETYNNVVYVESGKSSILDYLKINTTKTKTKLINNNICSKISKVGNISNNDKNKILANNNDDDFSDIDFGDKETDKKKKNKKKSKKNDKSNNNNNNNTNTNANNNNNNDINNFDFVDDLFEETNYKTHNKDNINNTEHKQNNFKPRTNEAYYSQLMENSITPTKTKARGRSENNKSKMKDSSDNLDIRVALSNMKKKEQTQNKSTNKRNKKNTLVNNAIDYFSLKYNQVKSFNEDYDYIINNISQNNIIDLKRKSNCDNTRIHDKYPYNRLLDNDSQDIPDNEVKLQWDFHDKENEKRNDITNKKDIQLYALTNKKYCDGVSNIINNNIPHNASNSIISNTYNNRNDLYINKKSTCINNNVSCVPINEIDDLYYNRNNNTLHKDTDFLSQLIAQSNINNKKETRNNSNINDGFRKKSNINLNKQTVYNININASRKSVNKKEQDAIDFFSQLNN